MSGGWDWKFGLVALGGGHRGHAGTQDAEPEGCDKSDHVGFSVRFELCLCCTAVVHGCITTIAHQMCQTHFLPFVQFFAESRFDGVCGGRICLFRPEKAGSAHAN